MKGSKFILLVLSGLVLASCRKDPPLPPNDIDAEFYATASVDGVQKVVEAGKKNYYMFTDYEVVNGVSRLVGNLKPISASEGPAWKISLLSNKNDGTVDPDSVLFTGNRTLTAIVGRALVPGHVNLTLKMRTSNNAETLPTFDWGVGSPGPSDDTITFLVDTVGIPSYLVTASITGTYANGEDLYSIRHVDLSRPDNWATFDIDWVAEGLFMFRLPQYLSEDVTNVLWSVNGNYITTADTMLYSMGSDQNKTIMVTATFRHAAGGSTSLLAQVRLKRNNQKPVFMDFFHTVRPGTEEDSVQLKSIEIEYTSPEGIAYTSSLNRYPGRVQLIDVSSYDPDKDGRPTRKLRIQGSFTLKAENGDEVRVDDADFIVAVATSDP